jgi:hypothetical protein
MLSFPLLSLQFGTSHSTCIFNHVTYTFNAIIYVHTTNLWQGKKVGEKKKTQSLHSNNHLSCHSFHIKIGKTFF